jgi:hypothetical protein
MLSQTNPVHITPSHLSKIHPNIIHPPTSWSSQQVICTVSIINALYTGFTGAQIWCIILESREDIVDEQEMENYLVCVMALQRLMQSERSLMVGIVPLQHQHQVFEIVIRDAMDMVVQDGEVLFL